MRRSIAIFAATLLALVLFDGGRVYGKRGADRYYREHPILGVAEMRMVIYRDPRMFAYPQAMCSTATRNWWSSRTEPGASGPVAVCDLGTRYSQQGH
jgi:hypothetical protein